MKKKKTLITLLVLLVLLILVFIYTIYSRTNESSNNDLIETKTFDTKVGEYIIKYPTKWQDVVTFNVKGTKVSASCNDIRLFDLTLGESGEGNYLGIMDDDKVSVYLKTYDINDKQKDKDDLIAMQDDTNVIIANLQNDYGFKYNSAANSDDEDNSNIKKYTVESKSAVLPIEYPEKWKDKVSIEEKGKAVKFSCGDVKLFDLHFEEYHDGYLLGTYDGKTKIYVVVYEIDKMRDNYNELCAMQEDINVIIQHWSKDKKFKINE